MFDALVSFLSGIWTAWYADRRVNRKKSRANRR
jgi:hypothetical protein